LNTCPSSAIVASREGAGEAMRRLTKNRQTRKVAAMFRPWHPPG
jgi:hypothetical protein